MIIKLSHKQTHIQNLSVQFSSRWYLCAQKSPYALHPVSQMFPQHCFEMVPMFQDLACKTLIETPPLPPNLSSVCLPYISTNIHPFSSQATKPIPWWNIRNRMRPRVFVQNYASKWILITKYKLCHKRERCTMYTSIHLGDSEVYLWLTLFEFNSTLMCK